MKLSTISKILFVFSLIFIPAISYAGTAQNMIGYAWSSNVGWISFNCVNDNTCATVDYGVNENVDGTLVGYAWSDNIGWIQFGGLSGFPTDTGTYAQNAQVVGGALRGWAQAIAPNGNGWTGWISLSSSASPAYGVTVSGSNFNGYAWNSDILGWILFDTQNTYPSVCTSCGVALSGSANFDVANGGSTLNGNTSVPYNTIPTFNWTITNLPNVSCSLSKTSSGGTAFATVSNITSSGSTAGSALTDGSYTYGFNCTNPTLSSQISFTVLPQPPGFSIGADDSARIQVLASGSAKSEQKGTFVSAVGGFNNPVTISISGFPTAPASTTFSYSLDGTHFSSNPTPVVLNSPYTSSSVFQMQIDRQTGAPAFTSPYTVTLTGTSSGYPSASKNIIITPTTFNPNFQEY